MGIPRGYLSAGKLSLSCAERAAKRRVIITGRGPPRKI